MSFFEKTYLRIPHLAVRLSQDDGSQSSKHVDALKKIFHNEKARKKKKKARKKERRRKKNNLSDGQEGMTEGQMNLLGCMRQHCWKQKL